MFRDHSSRTRAGLIPPNKLCAHRAWPLLLNVEKWKKSCSVTERSASPKVYECFKRPAPPKKSTLSLSCPKLKGSTLQSGSRLAVSLAQTQGSSHLEQTQFIHLQVTTNTERKHLRCSHILKVTYQNCSFLTIDKSLAKTYYLYFHYLSPTGG